MKLFRRSCLFAALFATGFFAACGGGGGGDNNGFVSVQQFESGSRGFWFLGTGGDMRIVSKGTQGNEDILQSINSKNKIYDQKIPTPFEIQSLDEPVVSVPKGWENPGTVTEQSRIVSGLLSTTPGHKVSDITSMQYSTSGTTEAYLVATFPTMSDTGFDNALASFFGCVTRNSVATSTSTNGNVNGNVFENERGQRVLFPSASGTSLHIWFHFNGSFGGEALIQLVAQVHYDEIQFVDPDTLEPIGEPLKNVISEGAAYTARNCVFRPTVN